MKLKSITIEGMRGVTKKTYSLEDIMYLYGNNGAGKSTVIKAIQWALLGYIPGTGKRNIDIFSHANGRSMGVSLVLSSGNNTYTISRNLYKQKTGIVSEVITEPEDLDTQALLGKIMLPVFDFSSFVNLSANNVKDWFLSFLPKEEIDIDWNSIFTDLSESLHVSDEVTINGLIAVASDCGSNIKGINSYVKQLLSAKKAERANIDGAIKSLIFYEDVDTDTSIDKLQADIASLTKVRDIAIRNQSMNQHRQQLLSKLSMYDDLKETAESDSNLSELLNSYNKFNSEIDDVFAIRNSLKEKIAELQSKIAVAKYFVSSGGICSYTGEVCGSIVSKIDDVKIQIDAMTSELQDTQSKFEEAANKHRNLDIERDNIHNKIKSIEARYEERTRLLASLPAPVEMYLDTDIDEIANQISDLNETIGKCLANEKFQFATDQFTKQGFVIDQTIIFLKECEKLTGPNGIQTDAASDPFDKFGDSVNKYIKLFFGKSTSIKFINSKAANSFDFGLNYEDMYISYSALSSGEQCLFAFSLMLSIIDTSDSKIKLLILDDAIDHLDDSNADKFFKALNKVKDVQIILAGVKLCNESYAVEVK